MAGGPAAGTIAKSSPVTRYITRPSIRRFLWTVKAPEGQRTGRTEAAQSHPGGVNHARQDLCEECSAMSIPTAIGYLIEPSDNEDTADLCRNPP